MNIKTIAQRLVLITLLLCNNTSMPAQNELPILGIIAAIFGLGAIGIHEYSSYCQKNNEVQLLNNVQDFIASITNNHKVEFQLIAQEGQNISEQGLERLAKIVNKFNSKEHSSSHAEQYYKNIASYKDQLKQHKHALISNIAQWSRQNNKDALITNARSYLQELSMLEKQLTDLQLVVYEHLNFFNSLKLNAMIAEKYKNEIELYYEHKKASHSDFSKKLTEAILVDAHQSNITFPFISMRDTINQDLPAIKKTVHSLKAHPSLNKYHHMLEVSQKIRILFGSIIIYS